MSGARLPSIVVYLMLAAGLSAAELPEAWTTDWDAATKRAAKEDKPLFVAFSASWCTPCQAMVKNIYPQPEVQDALKTWVPVYVDIDKLTNIADLFNVVSLPTMVFLNPDLTEINRTVGGISAPKKMVELLKTKGGARFEGGSRSPLIKRRLAKLEKEIEAAPSDVALRQQRLRLVLDAALDSTSMEQVDIARDDLTTISRLDRGALAKVEEEQELLKTLDAIKTSPKFADFYAGRFIEAFPESKRIGRLYVFLARTTMKKAQYAATSKHMKSYLEQFPKGGYADEFNLLLPQIDDFLKLSEGVSFD